MIPIPPSGSRRLIDLPAVLALEVDAVCDDFERHWRRARRVGTTRPDAEGFTARIAPAGRDVLKACLQQLEHELRSGSRPPDIPGLTLEEEIGRGGMGVVYRARRSDGRLVALKLIPGAERVRWTRWLAELADLRHPNLVPLEDFGTHQGLHYVVMPFVCGGDLGERLHELVIGADASRATLRSLARLAEKVVRAVAFLHRHGILHRDLKPSNILLTSPDSWEPLVCDFGLAGRLNETASGNVVGTPAYMAPEQMAGQSLTVAADLWSLGAVLYELLTGRLPYVGCRTTAELVGADPPPLVADTTLERVCRRCLEHDPADRYPTADELADDLLRYLDASPLSSPENKV